MSTIVLDLDSVLKNNSPLASLTKSKNTALIVTIPTSTLNHLESLPKGEKRVDFINSQSFVSKILSYCVCEYIENKKLCIIHPTSPKNLNEFVKALENMQAEPELVKLYLESESQ